jgi:hypothetical protein
VLAVDRPTDQWSYSPPDRSDRTAYRLLQASSTTSHNLLQTALGDDTPMNGLDKAADP